MLYAGTFRSICLYDISDRALLEKGHVPIQRAQQVGKRDSFFRRRQIKTVFTNIVASGQVKVDWGQCKRIYESSVVILASLNSRQPVRKSKSCACAKMWLCSFKLLTAILSWEIKLLHLAVSGATHQFFSFVVVVICNKAYFVLCYVLAFSS